MHVDVVDVFRFHFCVFESVAHHEFCAQTLRVGCSEVISVCRHTATGNLSIDVGAAGESVFQFLKDKASRAFTHNEAVARAAEWAGSVLRIVVACRQSVH